jgi:hypothetical protein
MASASSQAFGNLLAGRFQGFGPANYSNAFKTKLDPTVTTPVTLLEPPQGASSSMSSFGGQNFQAAMDAANAIPDETARSMAIAQLFGQQMRQQSDKELLEIYPQILDMTEQRQYANRLKARPLEFEEMIAKNLLKTITDIPGQIANAGQMYGREAATAFGRQTENFQAPQVVKYF